MEIVFNWGPKFVNAAKRPQVEMYVREAVKRSEMKCGCESLTSYVDAVDVYMHGASAVIVCKCGDTKIRVSDFQIDMVGGS